MKYEKNQKKKLIKRGAQTFVGNEIKFEIQFYIDGMHHYTGFLLSS